MLGTAMDEGFSNNPLGYKLSGRPLTNKLNCISIERVHNKEKELTVIQKYKQGLNILK